MSKNNRTEALLDGLIYDYGEEAPKIAKLLGYKLERTKLSKSRLEALKISKLKEYIEIANKIPPERSAIDIRELVREVWKNEEPIQAAPFQLAPGRRTVYPSLPIPKPLPKEGSLESWLLEFTVLLSYLERFPPDFREYVLEDSREHLSQINLQELDNNANTSHFAKLLGALDRYRDVMRYREHLRKIVRMNHTPRFFGSHSIRASYSLYLKDGVLERYEDEFFVTLWKIEVDRIRECPICGKLFWADRKDQKCCTKSCANVYRVRKSRTPEGRQSRSENRRYKRKVIKREKRSLK